MLTDLFPDLSDDARLWIYAADRNLTPVEAEAVQRALDGFCANWTSHGRPVRSAATVLYDRFLVIAGEIPGGDVSGCGIDSSTRVIAEVSQQLGFSWLPALYVFYRHADGVEGVPRPIFRQRVRDGAVTAATPVFDLGLQTLGALRRGAFEQPAGASWHARVFQIPAVAG